MVFVLLIGLSLLLYPTVSDKWNAYHQTRAIISHAESMAKISEEDCRAYREAAEEFNRSLQTNGGRWSFSAAERETLSRSFSNIDIPPKSQSDLI